jgi:hypothetical protein
MVEYIGIPLKIAGELVGLDSTWWLPERLDKRTANPSIDLMLTYTIPLYLDPATMEPWTVASIYEDIGEERLTTRSDGYNMQLHPKLSADWLHQVRRVIDKLTLPDPKQVPVTTTYYSKSTGYTKYAPTAENWEALKSIFNNMEWDSGVLEEKFSQVRFYYIADYWEFYGPYMTIEAVRQDVAFHFPSEMQATIKIYYSTPQINYVSPHSGSKVNFTPFSPLNAENTEYLVATFNKTKGTTDYYLNGIWEDLVVDHPCPGINDPAHNEDYRNDTYDYVNDKSLNRIEIIYD